MSVDTLGTFFAWLSIIFCFAWWGYWLTGDRFWERDDVSDVRIFLEYALLNGLLGTSVGWLIHG